MGEETVGQVAPCGAVPFVAALPCVGIAAGPLVALQLGTLAPSVLEVLERLLGHPGVLLDRTVPHQVHIDPNDIDLCLVWH